MKKVFLVATLICSTHFVFSQYRANNWVVPDSNGINFNTSTPSLFNTKESANEINSNAVPMYNVSCISSEQGNLLFYSSGERIYDSNNSVMPGADSTIWNYSFPTDGSTILPYPDHDSLYLLIYTIPFPAGVTEGLYYTVVNMNKRGGLGEVDTTQRNVLIYGDDSLISCVSAVRHANGRDWWILAKEYGTGEFLKMLLTPNGINYIGKQKIGFAADNYSESVMRFNPQGSQLAIIYTYYSQLEVLNFDRCSGVLSIKDSITNTSIQNTVGLSYSPNGRLLYYSSNNHVYQISGLDGGGTINEISVGSSPDSGYIFGFMQLGPDNKIYTTLITLAWPNSIYSMYNMSLCTIDSPDIKGIGCSFHLNHFYLGGKRCTDALPNMPNYNLGRLEGGVCDTITGIENINPLNENVKIFPNPANDIINLEILNGITPDDISITDLTGRIWEDFKPNRPFFHISIADLPQGIYFVRVKTAKETIVQKVVKE